MKLTPLIINKGLDMNSVSKIHDASLKILETVGIVIDSNEAICILEKRGARRIESNRLCIPEKLVLDAIEACPKTVRLCGMEEKYDLEVGGSNVYFGTGGTAVNVMDYSSGQRRPTTLADIYATAKLAQALDGIDFFHIPVFPSDLALDKVDINRFYAALCNTSKHISGSVYTTDGLSKVIELAKVVSGQDKRAIISVIIATDSPLKINKQNATLMLTAFNSGIPVIIPSSPISGLSSPVSLAGTLAQMNAEVLAGIVLGQTVCPGTPVLYGAVPLAGDMRTGNSLTGAPETGLMNAASVQLAKYYGLPIYATGGLTESCKADIKAGIEKALTLLLAATAGGNYIHDAAGLIDSSKTIAYEQYVLDNDLIGIVKRIIRGIRVDDETVGLDVIAKVGPGGTFIAESHTVDLMRKEHYYPTALSGCVDGSMGSNNNFDALKNAKSISMELLNKEKCYHLDQSIQHHLRTLIADIV